MKTEETGLATLVHNGLALGGLEDLDQAELLQWHSAAGGNVPDADMTVLLWLRLEDGTADWAGGWWDGEAWRLCESGGVCSATVTHWAEPAGPVA